MRHASSLSTLTAMLMGATALSLVASVSALAADPSVPPQPAAAKPAAPVAAPAAPASAAPPVAAPASSAAKANAPASQNDKGEPDYYTRRAQEILKKDAAAAGGRLHPLQASQPDFNATICDGGCSDESSAAIVALVPKSQANAVEKARLVTAASTGSAPGADLGQALIECAGGCYDDMPKIYMGRINILPGKSVTQPEMAAGWQTTVNPGEEKAEPEMAAAAPAAPAESAAAAQKPAGGSGDWMKKINLDRGPEAQPAAPAASSPAAAPAAAASKAAEGQSAAEKPVAAAPASAKPTETKPAAAKPVEAKPADTKPAEVKAAEVKPTTEIKPADAKSSGVMPPAAAKPVAEEPKLDPAKKPAPAAFEVKAAEAGKVEMRIESKVEPTAGKAEPNAAPTAGRPIVEAAPSVVAKPAVPVTPLARPDVIAAPAKPDKVAAVAPEVKAPEAKAPVAAAPAAPKSSLGALSSGDVPMDAAMQTARGKLDQFWSRLAKPEPGETDFAVKVAVADKDKVEYLWLTEVVRVGDRYVGTISNEPELVRVVKAGQRHEFGTERVVDWLYKRNGKLVGNETMRVLISRMSKKEAQTYRDMYETP